MLVCPLDWGLGHATRCIPVIRDLILKQARVVIAAAPSIKGILENEFPSLQFIDAPAYDVRYSKTFPLGLKLALQVPRLLKVIRKEHEWLNRIIGEHKIDVVISDNRYGLHSEKAYCIFITHQLFIPFPIFRKALNRKNHRYIRKFNECWIPDYEGRENLSGALSHGRHSLSHVKYIGPLSRFGPAPEPAEKKYDYCILLSGIEPQRSLLEEKLLKRIAGSQKRIVLIRGVSHATPVQEITGAEIIPFLSGTALQEKILQSEWLICRSGYSSIMDAAILHSKAILIPTPGQAEQEYLADYLSEKKQWRVVRQSEIDALEL